jgi:hypothetical protein
METPEVLNGWSVLSSYRCPRGEGDRPSRIILAQNGRKFVTAVICDGETEWYWGHYFHGFTNTVDDDFMEANEDFRARVRRGY